MCFYGMFRDSHSRPGGLSGAPQKRQRQACLRSLALAVTEDGDLYFDVAKNSTALHSAAWRKWSSTVKLLIARGASVNVVDGKGRTALALAVRACVDSYWKGRRRPESVEALLNAGASVRGVAYPSGYAEVDGLLRGHGAGELE